MQLAKTGFRCSAISLGVLSLIATVACGGGSPTLNNPQGNFSNASLSGSYVYELHGAGFDQLGNISPFRETGVFIADGKGNIGSPTPGSDDLSGSTTPVAVTGVYQVAQDGTGSITMTSQLNTIHLAMTMVSSSKVYLMDADAGLNSIGVAELQDSSAITSTPTGSFAFRIHEEVNANGAPQAQVGAFNAATSGTNGAMDQNAAGTFTSPAIAWTFNAPGALGRGTGTYLNTSTGLTNNFIYYIVSSSKIDLLSSDINSVGSGEAEAQTGSIGSGLSGNYAFGSSGDDGFFSQGIYETVASVGEFSAANGALTGTEDTNVDGNINSSVATATCETPSANGRVVVTSSSGGACTATTVQVFWMVNPNRAFFLDVNSSVFDDGTADQQTVSSFSQSTLNGQFALLMGGLDTTPTQVGLPLQLLTRVATLQLNSSGKLTLNELANASNNGGGQSPGLLTGTFSAASNGRITAGAGNGNGGVDFVMYGVSGSQAYVMQNDTGIITSGTLELQP